MKSKDAIEVIREQLFPAFRAEKERLDKIDKWMRWDHDLPHTPRVATREYKTLMERAQTPWLRLVVKSSAQDLYVDGYRSSTQVENAAAWDYWQANGMDSRQVAIHEAALGYGHSYASVLPGVNDFGKSIPVIRGISPRRIITFYREPENDDFPVFALRVDPAKVNGSKGWALKLYDDQNVYYLNSDVGGSSLTYIETREHNLGICPIVRYANQLDLEGRTPGEVEPFIPLAARIDQTVGDRLMVQRYASWIVRTISGMAKPDSEEEAAAKKLELTVADILIAEDKDTQFGKLEATPLSGFIEAHDADVRVLSAVSQTPSHEMLGQMANLSAEALDAAKDSHTSKVTMFKKSLGESHEQTLRLASFVMGDIDGASDTRAQVRWANTQLRSLSQAADALGKIATQLEYPVQLLWEMIPDRTQQDIDTAKALHKPPPEPMHV